MDLDNEFRPKGVDMTIHFGDRVLEGRTKEEVAKAHEVETPTLIPDGVSCDFIRNTDGLHPVPKGEGTNRVTKSYARKRPPSQFM